MNEPICKFYKRNGYCHFLNKCWYSHSSEPANRKNINYSSGLQTIAGEATSQSEAGLSEIASHEKKGIRRNSPLKRYGKRYVNFRNNFRPKPVRNPKPVNPTEFNAKNDQNSDRSIENKQGSCEINETTNSENTVIKETIDRTNQVGVPLGTHEHSPSMIRRKPLHGNRRWNIYKGPRYFYGNFGTRPKEQRTKRHGYSQKQELIHSENNRENLSQNQTEISVSNFSPENNVKSASNLYRSNTSFGRFQLKTSELLLEEFSKLLTTEIQQLKKRFPNHKLLENENSDHIYSIEYFPTDPDWPFQVSSLRLQLIFPPEYPKVLFSAFVLNEEHCLPELLIKHLNKTIQNWLKERQERNENNGVTELVFRPFLKWLDKNLENMFVCGLRLVKQEVDARAAGIEFIPYENLCNSLKVEELSASLNNNSEPNELSNSNTTDLSQDNILNEITLNTRNPTTVYLNDLDSINNSSSRIINISHNPEEIAEATQQLSLFDGGSLDKLDRIQNINATGSKTEVKFKNFYLSENAATLVCKKAQLTIQCSRCKTRHDLAAIANKWNCAACTKCHEMQEIFFESTMLHPNSSILGYIHLAQCKIIDLPLVSCEFLIGCLNCPKQCTLTGIHYDQQRVTWCHYCNSKMAVSIQGVRFLELHPEGIADKLHAQTLKLDNKMVKNAVITVQPGRPLPENGTCKHYKKSYRWLRFPCCGKAYPCDLCHNEKEIDHEMKLASRMICGFCAKEQPYSKDKECISCGSYTTKKSGTHWEGGKGCRDKNKMSKGDKHKYSGVSKTKSIKKVGLNVKKDAMQ